MQGSREVRRVIRNPKGRYRRDHLSGLFISAYGYMVVKKLHLAVQSEIFYVLGTCKANRKRILRSTALFLRGAAGSGQVFDSDLFNVHFLSGFGHAV